MRIIGKNLEATRETSVVASGTIQSGISVVVNSDGTVSAVSESDVTQSVGTPVDINGGNTMDIQAVVYDSSNDKIVLFYKDANNSSFGTAVVGTVSGNSISFGTAVVYESAQVGDNADGTYDENAGKVLIAYGQGANGTYARVGTVSGTSISFGTRLTITSDISDKNVMVYDKTAQKNVFLFNNGTQANRTDCYVLTISGTNVSKGSGVNIADTMDTSAATYDETASKTVIFYRNSDNLNYPTTRKITVSGTDPTFESAVVVNSAYTGSVGVSFEPVSDTLVFMYEDGTNNRGAVTACAAGGSSSGGFGTVVAFQSSGTGADYFAATHRAGGKVMLVWEAPSTPFDGTFVFLSVSGTTITLDTATSFDSGRIKVPHAAYDSNTEQMVLMYRDDSDVNEYGEAVIIQPTYTSKNLTAENFIGFSKSGAANGEGLLVEIRGSLTTQPETYYDIANASYDSVSFSVTSQDNSPQAFAFSADGTKMYVGGSQNNTVYQYTLSTAWDLSTASYASKSFSYSGQETGAQDIAFKTDGTKMFITGTSSDAVNEYALSTAWDVSTASFTVAFSVSSQDVSPQGVTFNPNGTQMYVTGNVSNAIFEYTLSTAWDVSSASYASKSLSVGTEEGEPRGVEFNSNGTKVFITGSANDSVFQYNLTTAYDISTGSYSGVSFAISEDGESRGPKFKSDGSKMYILGFTNDNVFQYTTLSNLTAGQSYYVQTDGTLSTTAGNPSVFAGTAVSATKLIVKG